MADGKVKIETELDQAGFKSGLQKLAQTVKTQTASLKKSLSDIGKDAKLKLDTSGFEDGTKKVKSYTQTLKSELKNVNAEVADLSSKYKQSASETGVFSKETQELADKLKEAKDKQSQLTDELDKGSSSMQKYAFNIGSIGDNIKSGLVTAAKAAAVGVATAAAGIATLSGLSIKAYASYEQLKGGVETLFGAGGQSIEEYAASVGKGVSDVEDEYNSLIAAQQTVLNNADAAWQTAGLSANDYMETVTSFSASLLQGLGGDTEKAAKIADQAVVDMSDNANKMGTDMQLIQNAYQGFAKQNYTMLDNLKLGYGGTQAEMARLINDSGVLGDTMEVTADTVNQVSFDKIIEAIHVIQDEMGITGTTADEAATTIEGSVNSMKAAWENLLTAMSSDDMDVGVYAENFANSVITVIQNLMPRIQAVLPNIADGLALIIEELGPYLLSAFETLLPYVIEGAIYLVAQLAAEIPTILGTVIQAIQSALSNIFSALPTDAQKSIQDLAQVLQTLAPVIAAVTAAILTFRTAMTIASIINGVSKAIQAFKTANQAATVAQAALNAVMNANPFVLIATLIAAVVAAVVTLWNTNEGFRNAVINAWEAVKSAISNAISSIVSAFNSLKSKISEALNNAIAAFDTFRTNLLNKARDIGQQVIDSIKNGISNAWNGLVSWFNGLWDGLFGNKTANVTVNRTVNDVDGSHASGLAYVPFNGYIAELHEGEMVLTRAQADGIRKMLRSGMSTLSMGINPTMQTSGAYGGNVVNQTIVFEGDVDDPDVVTRKIRQQSRHGLAGAMS